MRWIRWKLQAENNELREQLAKCQAELNAANERFNEMNSPTGREIELRLARDRAIKMAMEAWKQRDEASQELYDQYKQHEKQVAELRENIERLSETPKLVWKRKYFAMLEARNTAVNSNDELKRTIKELENEVEDWKKKYYDMEEHRSSAVAEEASIYHDYCELAAAVFGMKKVDHNPADDIIKIKHDFIVDEVKSIRKEALRFVVLCNSLADVIGPAGVKAYKDSIDRMISEAKEKSCQPSATTDKPEPTANAPTQDAGATNNSSP
jgi:DNA repair exonuclease SbcCD ATPase subunit